MIVIKKKKKKTNEFYKIKDIRNYYKKILNKLGKIWIFLKWYKLSRLENINIDKMFSTDNVLRSIFNRKINTEDKTLFYFIDLKKNSQKSIKNLNINPFSRDTILYFFRLFNLFFPIKKTKLEEKMKKIENIGIEESEEYITAKDILEEMDIEEKVIKIYLKSDEYVNELAFREKWKKEKKKIDDILGIIYSIYQFYINQYVSAVFKLLEITSNALINQEKYETLEKIKISFLKTLKYLLSKVVFLNDNSISYLYSKAKNNPTILSGVFNYKELIDNYKKNNIKTKAGLKNFELILIDYLYSMCKKSDEIRYLYEKITVLKYIRNLAFNKNYRGKRNDKQKGKYNKKDDDAYNENVIIQTKKILNLIWTEKRIPILLKYKEFNIKKNIISEDEKEESKDNKNNSGNNSEEIDIRENDFYVSFKVGEIARFTLRLLNLYEIDEFFGDILYIDCDDYFSIQEDYSIERIKKLKSTLSKIEKEIFKLRINSCKYQDEDNRKFNNYFEKYEANLFEYLSHLLSKIKSEDLEIFNFELYIFNTKNILYRMLLNENKTFYKKMEILSSLENMIQAINYRKGSIDDNTLNYISNLLRIFNKMIEHYPNFNMTIIPNFEIYISLIIGSLKCINDIQYYLIDLKKENIFLEIIYRDLDIFFYIIKNSNMNFEKIKEFMENTFIEIQNIYNQFKTKKNKYIYRILYLLCLCRILLYLNNDKSYDPYNYKIFYKKIFKLTEIDKYFFQDNNQIKNKEKIKIMKMKTIYEENSVKDSSNLSSKDENNSNFDVNYFPEEMQPFKINNEEESEESEEDSKNDSHFLFIKEDNNNNNELIIEESLENYKENEIENLSFYVSFLLIYSLYLNEKNSMNRNIDDEIIDGDEEEQPQLSLNLLLKKINSFLYNKNNNFNNDFFKNNISNTNNETLPSKNSTKDILKNKQDTITNEIYEIDETLALMNPGNMFPEKNIVDPQNLFIFSLLQAVMNFKLSSNNHIIEIPIKHYITKDEDEEISYEDENINLNETELFSKYSKKNDIIFYYYKSSHIDLIILEKILIEISLKTNLENYCLDGRKCFIMPELLGELLKNLNYFKLIHDYDMKEYNLINNHFVKNNLTLLIKKIFNTFRFEDLKEISQMNNFMYKRMGEVYDQELIKAEEVEEQQNFNLIEFLCFQDELNKEYSKNINIITFLESLIYIYPKYDKKICLILFKIGFEVLYNLFRNNKNNNDDKILSNINIGKIIKVLITLFNRKSYLILINDNYAFITMLLGMGQLFKIIKEKSSFFLKHFDMIKELLNSCDFIFELLPKDFSEIVKFLRRPENLVNDYDFNYNKKKLKKILEFFTILISFKKCFEEKIITENIIKTGEEIIKLSIKLLSFILIISKDKSIEIINIILDFFSEIIKGPDIYNLNLLFSLGFFDLVSYTIINVDYYKLFLDYINKDNLHKVINNYIRIECKIIKIFIAYYNISFSPKSDINQFIKLLKWYENNFKNIEKKLKKIFYISQKEMEGRDYDINYMLLFIKNDDKYNEDEMRKRAGITYNEKKNKEIELNNIDNNSNYSNYNDNSNIYNNEDDINNNNDKNDSDIKKENKEINSDFCIIKFELLLSYYTLFNYHKNLSRKDSKYAFTHRKCQKHFCMKMLLIILKFFYDFVVFLYSLIKIIILMVYYFSKRFLPKIKKDVDLLQDLQDIEIKAENIKSEYVIDFLENYIKEVEVCISNVIFKIYFPMTDRATTLSKYRKEYLKVDEIDSSDFINYLLSKYDYINIRAKQNTLVNKWIDEFPILNYIFKNIYIFGVLVIVFGLVTNFLILSSFNTFTAEREEKCGKNIINYIYVRKDKRIQCPRFMYSFKTDPYLVIIILVVFLFIQCILQSLTFIDYAIRTIFVESEIVKFNYYSEYLKTEEKYPKKMNIKYFLGIFFPTFFRCIFNFRTLYYIISIASLIASIVVHPFYNCIILLEFVNRIEVMQNILKAMYRPSKNILIILLMLIILEYFFSIFASSWFTNHFPNITDTKNFLKTFMRMIDQTFKQDGGIGTYLDKTLDPDYKEYQINTSFFSRFFFDLLFYLIVLLLILQMFLSVIIDYFNETRENSQNFVEAMETQCLVCGIDREKIEKINPNDKHSFNKHISYSHNVFNYIYYLMYLQILADRDVIIDDGVWNLHLIKNLSYLPKNEFFKNLEKQRWEALKKINK